MHRLFHVLAALRAEIARHHHVNAAAHTHEKTGKERDQRRRRADGAERFRPDEPADHNKIGHVKQQLKQI